MGLVHDESQTAGDYQKEVDIGAPSPYLSPAVVLGGVSALAAPGQGEGGRVLVDLRLC